MVCKRITNCSCLPPIVLTIDTPSAIQKVKVFALALFTNFVVRINPLICTVALNASFFWGKEVNHVLATHFFNDLAKKPCLIAIIATILVFTAPHFAIMAASTIYCTWVGSKFKMYLRDTV